MAKKILIVDDDPIVIATISEKLQKAGFETLSAKNGDEGYKLAIAEKPDLTLLDLAMPQTDGLTMLKFLRNDEWGKTAKVIILTNLTDIKNTQEGWQAGVYDYLVKADWGLDDLVKKVQEKIGS